MTRSLKYTLIDAFTTRAFGGNPTSIIILPDNEVLDDQTMQLIAREFNLSETAYVSKVSKSGNSQNSNSKSITLGLRWFTPRAEVPICGHATLAAAHIIFSSPAPTGVSLEQIGFETLSGTLVATKVPQDGKERIQLEFPEGITTPVDEELTVRAKDVLKRALNGAAHEVAYIGVGSGPYRLYMLIEIASPFALAEASVNPGAFLELAPKHAAIIVTTKPSTEDVGVGDGSKPDYVCRFFGPSHDVPEDPATGSAQCILGPYWHKKLYDEAANAKILHAKQLSERGGEFDVAWDREKGTCRLFGDVVIVGEGTLYF